MNIDLNLLIAVHSVQGKSNETEEIEQYIKDYITDVLHLTYTTDTYGNIYVTKGTGRNGYKCIVSHVDTVHDKVEERKVYQQDDILFAFGYDNKSFYNKGYKQVGVGGDDRVGVTLCLQALTDVDDIKAVFYKNEEIGHLGSRASDIDFLSDCNFIVEPDRKGYDDFITTSAGIKMCSVEFENTVKPILDKYSYKVAIGVSTDVDTLKSRGVEVCCFNISCGYFNPHSANEIVSISCVDTCYTLLLDLWEEHGNTRFEHKYIPPVYKNVYNYATKVARKLGFLKEIYNKESYIQDVKHNDFRPAANWSVYYKYTGAYSITLKHECPVCKGIDTLRFIPNENAIYCVGKCNNFIKDMSLVNDLVYTDSKSRTEFRYLTQSKEWVKETDSKYSTVTKTYIYSPSYTSHYDDYPDY